MSVCAFENDSMRGRECVCVCMCLSMCACTCVVVRCAFTTYVCMHVCAVVE